MEECHGKKSLPEDVTTGIVMQSDQKTVDLYMATVPRERLAALNEIRKYCRVYLKDFEESMKYGVPSYKRNGVAEVAFNSQKHFIALYIKKKGILDQYRHELSDLNVGKGCIRYSNPEQIRFDIVKKLLTGTYKSKGTICHR